MPVVSISMPGDLLSELDAYIEAHGYSGRSEALREGTRELLAEGAGDSLDSTDPTICIVMVLFEQDVSVEVALSSLRHDHAGLVTDTLHSHVGDCCFELYVVEGVPEDIGSFIAKTRSVDGVDSIEHSPVAAAAEKL